MSLKGLPLLYPGLVLYPHPHPTSAVILRTLNNGPATPLIGLYYKIIKNMKCMFFQEKEIRVILYTLPAISYEVL